MLIAAALLLVQTAPVCTAKDVGLPAPLAGWTKAMPHPGLMLGHATELTAAAGAASTEFKITTAGTYGVALDQAGWIDVAAVGASKPLVSVKHGHGPDCSTIRKIVRFDLKPGTYRLTLAKLPNPKAKVMLVRD